MKAIASPFELVLSILLAPLLLHLFLNMTDTATPTRKQFRYTDRLRVRWAEVDMQKIVFNGHYLMYFDTAVAGYWRALAMPYHETMESLHGDFFVRKATLEYEASARYDEQLHVGVRCAHIGNSSMRLHAAVFRGEQRLVWGELIYVFADPATQTSKPVPPALRDLFLGHERGEPVVSVQVGDWRKLGAQARALRDAVFVQEQGIAANLEHDGQDATATHALAVNRLGLAVGTGRLLPHETGVAKLGRMAVLASVRSAGVGKQVLDALLESARTQGFKQVLLHAQADAVAFYERAGFARSGEPFSEAGIAHQAMVKTLP
jgi:YbgC/YbaW family acyl-CoA thioester hydrolase